MPTIIMILVKVKMMDIRHRIADLDIISMETANISGKIQVLKRIVILMFLTRRTMILKAAVQQLKRRVKELLTSIQDILKSKMVIGIQILQVLEIQLKK